MPHVCKAFSLIFNVQLQTPKFNIHTPFFPCYIKYMKPPKSPWKSPFLTWISPFILPNLTKTLGWVNRFGRDLPKKTVCFFWQPPLMGFLSFLGGDILSWLQLVFSFPIITSQYEQLLKQTPSYHLQPSESEWDQTPNASCIRSRLCHSSSFKW